MPTAIIYTRVSTDSQVEAGVSLDAQEATCLRYCAANNISVFSTLREEGVSAYSVPLAQRPRGAELLTHIAAGRVSLVVAYQMSRLFRNHIEALTYGGQWAAIGVGMSFPGGSGSVDLDDPMREFMFGIEALKDRMSSRETSRKVRDALNHIAREGGWPGRCPVGYYRPTSTNVIFPDPAWAPLVRELFSRAAAGEALVNIARDLNLRAIPCRQGGEAWTTAHLRRILGNHLYRGEVRWHSLLVAGNHEPLVDQDLWARVQALLAGRKRAGELVAGQYLRSRQVKHLTPLFVCGVCGAKAHRHTGKRGTLTNYVCGDTLRLEKDARHAWNSVTVTKAEEAVWRQLVLDLRPEELNEMLRRISAQTSGDDRRRLAAQARLREIDTALERTLEMVRLGYPVEMVERGDAPLLEERLQLEELLRGDANLVASAAALKRLKRVDPVRFVQRLQAEPVEDRLQALWLFYSAVRFWNDRLEFVSVAGPPLVRPLPAMYGPQRKVSPWEW